MYFCDFFPRQLGRFVLIAATASLISCSSKAPAPKTTAQTSAPAVNEIPAQLVAPADITAAELVAQAQNQLDSPAQANQLLIAASSRFLSEQQTEKALWLANQLLQTSQTPIDVYQLLLLSAQSNFLLGEKEKAFSYLIELDKHATTNKIKHPLGYYQLYQQVELLRGNKVHALNAYLHAFSLNTNAGIDELTYIWQEFSQLSTWQLNQLDNLAAPYATGWVDLAKISNKYASPSEFDFQINLWQKKYPSHPANGILPSIQAPSLVVENNYKNIAVILPLTGKQASAGLTIQQGILAAYDEQKSGKLHFIDSQTFDLANLASYLVEKQIDFIIGPLLKEKVEAFLALAEITTPSLLLNVPSESSLLPHQIAMSMRPEDEAIQAASLLSQKNYQFPLVLSYNDSISQRMTNAFVKQWQALTGVTPQQVVFEQDSQVQRQVKESLGVDSSQARIREVKSVVRRSIDSEFRNRRDIDMIYVVANPNQTRLLKPYIDVNISPFAKLIPVFASSRSHSIITDSSALKDLEGLTFTEIPWLLPSQQQNVDLANISQQLWPQRSDTLQNLFAMGYDSLKLMNKLPQMKQQAYIRHFGQTGVLKLGQDNVLTRSLLWGKYNKNKLTEIVIE